MSHRGILVAALVLAAGLSLLSAQATIDAPEETVRLDVIVTDRHERPIRDLRIAEGASPYLVMAAVVVIDAVLLGRFFSS